MGDTLRPEVWVEKIDKLLDALENIEYCLDEIVDAEKRTATVLEAAFKTEEEEEKDGDE